MEAFAELVMWCLGSFWRWLGVLLWIVALSGWVMVKAKGKTA